MKYFTSTVQAAKAFISSAKGRKNQDDSFWICDLGEAASCLQNWSHKLPGIRPFYAMKSAPHPSMIKVFLLEGAGIDCASEREMELALELGAKPEDIIYSNTNKQISHLQFARRNNINLTVYDCKEELRKIHEYHPQAKLLLRVKGLVEAGSHPMSERFGATSENAKRLLRLSNELGARTVGISFHVGTACRVAEAYEYAINEAKKLMVYARKIGINCEILNIGGGFEGTKDALKYFEENAAVVRDLTKGIVSDSRFSQLQLIAEPGRYFAESSFSLVANVIAKKAEEDIIDYTLNEGVWTSFFTIMAGRDHGEKRDMLPLKAIRKKAVIHRSRLYGPSCASFDFIMELNMAELDVGDWLIWKECGAYTFAFGADFNCFRTGVAYDIVTERNRKHLSNESLQYIASTSKCHD